MFSRITYVPKQDMISAFVSHELSAEKMARLTGGDGGGGGSHEDNDDVTTG